MKKYRQDGHLQPPENLQYRYEAVKLYCNDGDEVTTDCGNSSPFGSPKRKVIDVPRGKFGHG